MYLQALELDRRLLGHDHPSVAIRLNNLAALYKAQNRYNEAESRYLEAIEICDRALGPAHPDTVYYREKLELLRMTVKGVS